MINRLLVLILTLLFLTSCQSINANASVEVITINPSEFEIMFIPQNSIEDMDKVYVDAIIELKALYPSKFADIKKEEKNISGLNTQLATDSPTLLIRKNGQTINKISGNIPKNEIIDQLENTIDKANKDNPI